MEHGCQGGSCGEDVDTDQAADSVAQAGSGCLTPKTHWRPAWLSVSETGPRSHRLRTQRKGCLPAPPCPASRCRCHVQAVTWVSDRQVPMGPSLSSVNSLEWLTKLREMFYLVDYWFTLKEYNPVTARWKRCIQQGVRKEWETSCHLWAIHSSKSPLVNQPSFPNPVPMEAALLKYDCLNL